MVEVDERGEHAAVAVLVLLAHRAQGRHVAAGIGLGDVHRAPRVAAGDLFAAAMSVKVKSVGKNGARIWLQQKNAVFLYSTPHSLTPVALLNWCWAKFCCCCVAFHIKTLAHIVVTGIRAQQTLLKRVAKN